MTTIQEKFEQLKSAGFTPLVDAVAPLPVVGDPQGSFFAYALTSGVGVSIFQHPSVAEPHEVHGSILDAYLLNGGPTGVLGYPMSDEHDDDVGNEVRGRVSEFQKGSLLLNPVSGDVTLLLIAPEATGAFEILDGIDVSEFQAEIDWMKVASVGTQQGQVIRFAYIRATLDDTGHDTHFDSNWKNSKGKLLRGAYHAFRAKAVVDDTRTQANTFLAALPADDLGDLPPMVDVEFLPNNVSVDQAVASLRFFLSIVEEGIGRAPIIYTYPSFWTHGMANASVFTKQHLWIANYGAKRADGGFEPRGIAPIIPGSWPTFSIWQNAVQPGVAGIQTLVDRDVVLLPDGVDLATFLTRPRDDLGSP